MALRKRKHRWSGWPGAFCLNCGVGDPNEICIAVHDEMDFICVVCNEHWPQGLCINGEHHDILTIHCPDHPMTACEA